MHPKWCFFVTLTDIPALHIKPAASSPAGKLNLHINAESKRTSSGDPFPLFLAFSQPALGVQQLPLIERPDFAGQLAVMRRNHVQDQSFQPRREVGQAVCDSADRGAVGVICGLRDRDWGLGSTVRQNLSIMVAISANNVVRFPCILERGISCWPN